jgi:protein-S-isoprenylcysteine O-methyltransferase Ste14
MDRRVVAWSGTAILFVALYAGVPLAGLALDGAIGLGPLPLAVRLVGPFLFFAGLMGLGWCFVLFARARGTPNPVMPPVKLVTSGPYAWMRNPIAGSHFLAVLGVALVVGSPAAVAITFLLGIPADLVTRREERGLESRFGEAYRAYRASVPRWIPRVPTRQS